MKHKRIRKTIYFRPATLKEILDLLRILLGGYTKQHQNGYCSFRDRFLMLSFLAKELRMFLVKVASQSNALCFQHHLFKETLAMKVFRACPAGELTSQDYVSNWDVLQNPWVRCASTLAVLIHFGQPTMSGTDPFCWGQSATTALGLKFPPFKTLLRSLKFAQIWILRIDYWLHSFGWGSTPHFLQIIQKNHPPKSSKSKFLLKHLYKLSVYVSVFGGCLYIFVSFCIYIAKWAMFQPLRHPFCHHFILVN